MKTGNFMQTDENTQTFFQHSESRIPAGAGDLGTKAGDPTKQKWLPVPIDSDAHRIIQQAGNLFGAMESNYWPG